MSNIEKLTDIMARLRSPHGGCPWDLEQDFRSLVPHTLEEAYEVAETIETGQLHELSGELGDLLFQVVFYARLAEEQGRFDFEDVVEGIVRKLVSRHPHVFGDDASITDARQQSQAWEAHKARERAGAGSAQGTLAGVASSLPATTRAMKLQKRAARVGFNWPDVWPVFDKVQEELEELRVEIAQQAPREQIEDEMGDLLFACINLSRMAGIDPETALRGTNRKFERRFAHMEAAASADDTALAALDLAQWEALWERAKAGESVQTGTASADPVGEREP